MTAEILSVYWRPVLTNSLFPLKGVSLQYWKITWVYSLRQLFANQEVKTSISSNMMNHRSWNPTKKKKYQNAKLLIMTSKWMVWFLKVKTSSKDREEVGLWVQGYKQTLKTLSQGNCRLPRWPKAWGFEGWSQDRRQSLGPTQGREGGASEISCAHKCV